MRTLLAALITAALAAGQSAPERKGTTERVKVHAKSLEGNLSGEPADRDVSIYLPPGYARNQTRRYPVIYLLHGFTDSDDKWFGLVKHWINVPQVLDQSLSNAAVKEMIVVMPNAYTKFGGSMYSSSVTTGDWETFVAKELVAFIDRRYRTIPSTASRGLAGHSMGGYGTLRIGMKHPETFAALYALSPCCLAPDFGQPMSAERLSKIEGVRSYEDLAKSDFMVKAMYASAAAWSPNAERGPFFVDFPWANGEVLRPVADKWNANAPLVFVDQYIYALRRLKGLALDAGDRDGSISATVKTMHGVLEKYGVAHFSEIYEGDHLNRIASRIETNVMPFFSERLAFR